MRNTVLVLQETTRCISEPCGHRFTGGRNPGSHCLVHAARDMDVLIQSKAPVSNMQLIAHCACNGFHLRDQIERVRLICGEQSRDAKHAVSSHCSEWARASR